MSARIKGEVASALSRQIPGAETVVTTDPVALDSETVLDRVMVVTARNGAPGRASRHVFTTSRTVWRSRSTGKSTASFRSRPRMSWPDGLEEAIAAELGTGVEVDTHIEPLRPADAFRPTKRRPSRCSRYGLALAEFEAAQDRALRNIHDVRVRPRLTAAKSSISIVTSTAVHDGADRA